MTVRTSSGVVSEGLVFAFDVGSDRCYIGEPTTNIYTDYNFTSSSFTNCSYDADKKLLISNNVTNAMYVLNNSSVTSGLNYTHSCEVKYGGYQYFQIAPSTGFTTTHTSFDLINGTITTNATGATMEKLADGWYRCSLTKPATATTSGRMVMGMAEVTATRLPSVVGDGVSGVYLRNPQIEQKSYPTRYVAGGRTAARLENMVYNADGVFQADYGSAITATNNTIGNFSANANSYLAFSGSTTAFSLQNQATIELWMYPTASSSTGQIISLGATDNLTLRMADASYNIYVFSCTSNSPVTANTWNHVVATLTQGSAQLYINGVNVGLTGTTTGKDLGTASISSVYIGRHYSVTSSNFVGRLDVIRTYNRPLSADEVKQNFFAQRTRFGV